MTRIRTISSFACVIAIAIGAAAAPMGPIKPNAGRFSVGLEGDVLARRLQSSSMTTFKTDYGSAEILGKIGYGLTDRFEIWGRLGYASLVLQDVAPATGTLEFDNAFAWGVGGGGILVDETGWNLAVQGNYNRHGGHTITGVATGIFDISLSDWNIGAQVQV